MKRPSPRRSDPFEYGSTVALLRRHTDLLAASKRLLAAYETEEDEYGFPFNFELRDAHRAFRALVDEQEQR